MRLYYQFRFPEEGLELHFLTRLWGQSSLTFTGHEYKVPFQVCESFEDTDDATLRSYSAVIVPSAIVSDRLRYVEDVDVDGDLVTGRTGGHCHLFARKIIDLISD